MFSRELQREFAVVAIAACAPLVFGCASTNRFVVDPGLSTSMVVESVVEPNGNRTDFDAAGGRIDPAAMTVAGTTKKGESLTVPVEDVKRFFFRHDGSAGKEIKANPAALIDGADWRPDGQVQYIALRTGEVIDVRKIPTAVDAQARAVTCTPTDRPASAIAFDQIVYVQIRDTHPGRTFLCVLVSAFFAFGIASGIAMASGGIGLGGGGGGGY